MCRGMHQASEKPEERKIWCLACGLCQFTTSNCRRCGAALPKPEPLPAPAAQSGQNVVRERVEHSCPRCGLFADETHFPTLAEAEELLIQEAMRRAHGQPSEASRLLGIGRTTLYRRLHSRQAGRSKAN